MHAIINGNRAQGSARYWSLETSTRGHWHGTAKAQMREVGYWKIFASLVLLIEHKVHIFENQNGDSVIDIVFADRATAISVKWKRADAQSHHFSITIDTSKTIKNPSCYRVQAVVVE